MKGNRERVERRREEDIDACSGFRGGVEVDGKRVGRSGGGLGGRGGG